jgi:peptide deformylase
MTKDELKLINSGTAEEPFRVLLTTNVVDSLILRKPCHDIQPVKDNQDLQLLIERMKITMETAGGIGIAAPQVGILRNVFLFVRLDKEDMPVQVAINPKIIAQSEETFVFEGDGCLSIPDTSGNSIRYVWIEVEYCDENGNIIKEKLFGGARGEDFTGVIFQHEYDHLKGILFIDREIQPQNNID